MDNVVEFESRDKLISKHVNGWLESLLCEDYVNADKHEKILREKFDMEVDFVPDF